MSQAQEPSRSQPAAADGADQQEAVDEAFRALLEGLRTTLPGVQVLLAFLLVLPLQTGFGDTSAMQRGAYLVAVMSSALAVVLLIAPSAHQRVRAMRTSDRAAAAGVPRRDEQHLRTTVTITMAGTILAAVAMTTAVGLAGSFVLGPFGLALGAVVGATLAWAWFYVPTVMFD